MDKNITNTTKNNELYEDCSWYLHPKSDNKEIHNIYTIKEYQSIYLKLTNDKIIDKDHEDGILKRFYEDDNEAKFKIVIFENANIDYFEVYGFSHNIIFDNCTFKNIVIKNIDKNENGFYFDIRGGTVENFFICEATINTKFYINRQYNEDEQLTRITKLSITNTTFKENFKLHNCEINEVIIQDVDFEKNADFYKSKFFSGQKAISTLIATHEINDKKSTNIEFKAINFNKLALFGDTIFKQKLIFKYVTIEGFSHFRKAQFRKGLDLDYVNIQNEMNFFGAKYLNSPESKQNTSQETYRIIKHNFEKLGNKIEANKYHSLELSKNRNTIWMKDEINLDLLQRGISSFIHWLASNHSSYWFISLIWIFIIGVVTSFNIDNEISTDSIFKFITIWSSIDDFCDNHIVYMLNKVSLGYLYYQFLTAVRKDTRK